MSNRILDRCIEPLPEPLLLLLVIRYLIATITREIHEVPDVGVDVIISLLQVEKSLLHPFHYNLGEKLLFESCSEPFPSWLETSAACLQVIFPPKSCISLQK